MLSAGGLSGIRVALVDSLGIKDGPIKWDGISLINNLQYAGQRITVWRSYDIGSGKIIDTQLPKATTSFSGTFKQGFSPGDFVYFIKEGRQAPNATFPVESQLPSADILETVEEEVDTGVFSCPSEGCIKCYQRYSALEQHMAYGKCELRPERATLLDQAKQMYHIKLIEGISTGATSQGERAAAQERHNLLARGWALKQTKKAGRFNEAQKIYLNEKFSIGQQKGHKLDPLSVALDMRYAKNAEGNWLFTRAEFLTAQQVQSYFSRQAGKLRHQPAEDDSNDHDAAVEQQQYWDTRAQVLQEVQLRHPVAYDTFDLCAMYHANKLNQLSVAMLKCICEYFDVNKEQLTVRRKAPYIALLGKLIESCTCREQQ